MTAPTLPAAPARVGVAPGWWVTGIRHAAQTGHRLEISAITGKRSTVTLCGRQLVRPGEVRADAGFTDTCADCRAKAARCPDPTEPAATRTTPPPTTRRPGAADTGQTVNTAAARVRRRAAFRDAVVLSDGALDYVPQPYGFDQAAIDAAALRGSQR